ncbi:MAG: hypothetical protein ACXQS1_00455, partial [Methermicoccaceae archaeon]
MQKEKGYSDKLCLDDFFSRLSEHRYLIIKKSESFPNYYRGSDVDIYCDEPVELAKSILLAGKEYVLSENLEIEVTNDDDCNHVYIDLYADNELEFRFDIYGRLPDLKNLSLKPELFSEIIENRVPVYRVHEGKEYPIYVPSEIDDFLLRYIEYLEWYERRPDKIKHLDYVLDHVSDEGRSELIDKLHRYTKLQRAP